MLLFRSMSKIFISSENDNKLTIKYHHIKYHHMRKKIEHAFTVKTSAYNVKVP